MDKVGDISVLDEEMEDLREKLNKGITKNIEYRSKEEYNNLLTISKELDDIIVKYIKSFNK